ncbi:hypothetical protein E2C05_31705, partial [Paracraurococcus ruber]|uniref:hypothetical protein n=1 Tax=Paracraurococcus ruber TaxID=77675 RepID=UPI00195FFC55
MTAGFVPQAASVAGSPGFEPALPTIRPGPRGGGGGAAIPIGFDVPDFDAPPPPPEPDRSGAEAAERAALLAAAREAGFAE